MRVFKFLFLAVIGAALVGGLMIWKKLGHSDGVVLTFTEEEIEQRLDAKFPITEDVELIKEPLPIKLPVTVQTPEISLIPDTNRLRARITAEINALLAKYEASASFSCGIRYEASDQSLRLVDPAVEEIETSKIPEKYRDQVHLLATLLAQRYLNDQAVYTLKDEDLKGQAARLLLKEVEVKDGLLHVRLGL